MNKKKEKKPMTTKEIAQGITGMIVMFFALIIILASCGESTQVEDSEKREIVNRETNEDANFATLLKNDSLIKAITSEGNGFENRIKHLAYNTIGEEDVLVVHLYNFSFVNDSNIVENAVADVEYLNTFAKAIGYDKGVHVMHFGIEGISENYNTSTIRFNKDTIHSLGFEVMGTAKTLEVADMQFFTSKVPNKYKDVN